MIRGKYLYNTDDISELLEIRDKVFHSLENVKYEINQEIVDEKSVYAIAYSDNIPVATGRLRFENQIYYIDQLLVITEEQRKGYGDFIVRMLIDKAFLLGGEEIIVYAPSDLIGFFIKIGFKKVIDLQTSLIKLRICRNQLLKSCQIH